MGRKSTKGREKKLKIKKELDMIKAKQVNVDAANSMDDPMALLVPFKRYDRNGLSLQIECCRVGKLNPDAFNWAFQLVKENMEALYEQSEWGWSDEQKREEMKESTAWYLVARNADGDPVACVHFRFDLDEEMEVLYCYEIQLTKEVRRKGLGKFLMQILELLAHKTQMKKVVLTAFKHNSDAQNFFIKKLKYEVDETNPEDTLVDVMFDDELEETSYQILSKHIAPRKASMVVAPAAPKAAVTTNGHSNGVKTSS